ncbi:unnamed protein product, partial [Pleuronectes platessa]
KSDEQAFGCRLVYCCVSVDGETVALWDYTRSQFPTFYLNPPLDIRAGLRRRALMLRKLRSKGSGHGSLAVDWLAHIQIHANISPTFAPLVSLSDPSRKPTQSLLNGVGRHGFMLTFMRYGTSAVFRSDKIYSR